MSLTMYDEEYIRHALRETKRHRFWWEPKEKWHFAVQVYHHKVDLPGTTFRVMPFFFPNDRRIEIWPDKTNLTSLTFPRPFPNMLFLMHEDRCVWNQFTYNPKDPKIEKVRLDLQAIASTALVAIRGFEEGEVLELEKRWSSHLRERPYS